MTEPLRAVFLSYASQDAETARRICDALRVIGIEVWFDKSELRGGDAWDRQIRRKIRGISPISARISWGAPARSTGQPLAFLTRHLLPCCRSPTKVAIRPGEASALKST